MALKETSVSGKNTHGELRKNSRNLMISTFICRILGFFREILTADIIGGGLMMSAWVLASTIANMARRILGEGAVGMALVPLLSATLKQKGKEAAREEFSAVCIFLTLLLSGLCIGATLLILILQHVVTSQVWLLAFRLLPIVMPYMIFICLVGIFSSYCNCFRSYFLPSLTAILQNLLLIAALYLLCSRVRGFGQLNILAWTVLLSGILEFAFMVFLLKYMGLLPVFKRNIVRNDAVVKRLFAKASYGILGMSALQVSMLCDRVIASWISDYAPAALYNSDRLIYLPVGIFAVAFGTVSLTEMSHMTAEGRYRDMMGTLMLSLRDLLFITVPLVAFMMLFSTPLIRMFFYRGAFDQTALEATEIAFWFYCLGIPAFACLKIFTAGFYASQDMKTPLLVSIGCILLNLILNLLLMSPLEQGGIALATVIASYTNNGILLVMLLKRFGEDCELKGLTGFLLRLLPVSWGAGGAAFLIYRFFAAKWFVFLDPYMEKMIEGSILWKIAGFLVQAFPLGIAALLFGIAFLFLGTLCRIPETERFSGKIRRIIKCNRL